MIKNIIIAVLAVALLGLGFLLHLAAVDQNYGATGQTHYQKESFLQGLFFGTTRQASLASDGTADFASLLIDGNTVTTEKKCSAVTSWNPGSVTATSTATTTLTVTGAAVGDSVPDVALGTSTVLSTIGKVSAADTVLVTLFQTDGDWTPIDLATTTVQACYEAH